MGDTGTTGKDFLEHWDWAAQRGLMNANTAGARRAAISKVLEIEPGWETLDITKLNVDEILQRFQTLKAKEYKPDSLRDYLSRFRKAHASYLEYLEAPTAWRAGGTRPERVRPRRDADEPDATDLPRAMPTTSAPSPGYVEYPFPLREGRLVRMTLPTDLKASEVKRIGAFLSALVVEQDA